MPVIRINFQTQDSSTPDGYLADEGFTFGDRTDGYRYGWSSNNRRNARDYGAPPGLDLRYGTLNEILPRNNFAWEIDLPNGSYRVRIVAGDPTAFDSVYRILAEGVLVVDGVPTSSQRWVEGEAVVDVSDGRLTLTAGPGAVRVKINFIEISSP
jgi:hypothetical protein